MCHRLCVNYFDISPRRARDEHRKVEGKGVFSRQLEQCRAAEESGPTKLPADDRELAGAGEGVDRRRPGLLVLKERFLFVGFSFLSCENEANPVDLDGPS